jgi:hypothetical protein
MSLAGSSSSSTRAEPRATAFGLEGEVLARSARGDGRHLVLKVELEGAPAVVKFYGRKRAWLRDAVRHLGQRLIVGKSGMTPAARQRTERDTLALWRAHGFDVPALLERALPPRVPRLHIVSEFVAGELLSAAIRDPRLPLAEKQRLLARLAAESGRRHDLALRLAEPRLIQVHAALDHVFYVRENALGAGSRERLATFDFEVVWTRRSGLPALVELELMQLLQSIARSAPVEQVGPLIRAFAAAYPAPERLPRSDSATRVGLRRRRQRSERKGAVLRHLEQALPRVEAEPR